MGSPGQGGLEWLKPNEKHVLGCYWTFRVCTGPPVMIFGQFWKNVFFHFSSIFLTFFNIFWEFGLRSGPDPGVRSDSPVEPARISLKNMFLLVLEPQTVHNRSKTTCNLPGTLVGHSKITISLLNSAWFARYSGFQFPALIDPPLFVSITTGAPLYREIIGNPLEILWHFYAKTPK